MKSDKCQEVLYFLKNSLKTTSVNLMYYNFTLNCNNLAVAMRFTVTMSDDNIKSEYEVSQSTIYYSVRLSNRLENLC